MSPVGAGHHIPVRGIQEPWRADTRRAEHAQHGGSQHGVVGAVGGGPGAGGAAEAHQGDGDRDAERGAEVAGGVVGARARRGAVRGDAGDGEAPERRVEHAAADTGHRQAGGQPARSLGISLRTLSRLLSEVMQELGTSSRFEAGVRAAKLGWWTDVRDEL
ncbi:hypothetical protein ACIRYZ_25530 [Kitasatospora sp. NPDC101155]|uniref:hypothetical protein n=1 Tax=Kitasatospora sp. NPDC101155 TaxID=3364097 RepID=UPI0037FC3690